MQNQSIQTEPDKIPLVQKTNLHQGDLCAYGVRHSGAMLQTGHIRNKRGRCDGKWHQNSQNSSSSDTASPTLRWRAREGLLSVHT